MIRDSCVEHYMYSTVRSTDLYTCHCSSRCCETQTWNSHTLFTVAKLIITGNEQYVQSVHIPFIGLLSVQLTCLFSTIKHIRKAKKLLTLEKWTNLPFLLGYLYNVLYSTYYVWFITYYLLCTYYAHYTYFSDHTKAKNISSSKTVVCTFYNTGSVFKCSRN